MYDAHTKKGGVRMQKKDADGLFINSSVRRAGLLKTLLRRFRNERETGEEEMPGGENDRSFIPGSARKERGGNDNTCMKRAVSL